MQQLKLKTKTTHQNNWFSKSEISLERMRVRGVCVCVRAVELFMGHFFNHFGLFAESHEFQYFITS